MTKEVPWENWCRLCSREIEDLILNGQSENSNSELNELIERYFCIKIINIHIKICNECHNFLEKIKEFSEQVAKVNEMLTKLFNGKVVMDPDGLDIREKFGIHINDCHKIQNKYTSVDTTVTKKIVKLELTDDTEDQSQDEISFIKTEMDFNDESSETVDNRIMNTDSEPIALETKIGRKRSLPIVNYTYIDDTNSNEDNQYADHDYDIDLDCKFSQHKDDTESIKKEMNSFYGKNKLPPTNEVNISENEESEKLINDNARKQYECEICGKIFSIKTRFLKHMKNVHVESKFECFICLKKFTTEIYLNRHQISHNDEKPSSYSCPYCDKKFSYIQGIKPHIRSMHVGEKTFICEECGKSFRSNGALKDHMYTHTDETPFKCTKCDAKFKNKYRLKRHEDIHPGTTYICPHCGLKLNTRGTLNSHLKTHSDEKKHKCEYCGIGFRKSSNLKHHLISHTGLKPFSCKFCDKTFTNRQNCRLHIKKVHPKECAELGSDGSCLTRISDVPTLDQLKALAAKLSLCSNVNK